MTKLSTAVVVVSGKGFGPFGSSGWRASGFIELVEGGGSGPFLIFCGSDQSVASDRSMVLMSGDDYRTVGKALLVSICSLVGGEVCQKILSRLPSRKGEGESTSFDDVAGLSQAQTVDLAREVVGDFKLGVVLLEPDSALNEDVQDFLGELGFTISVFSENYKT